MRLSCPFVALVLCLVALACAAAPAGAATRVPVQAAPELPAGASLAGAVSPERQLDLYVALEPRDPAALERFAEEVATPGSPVYGRYVSVPQFAARFAPTAAEVATVRQALVAQGLEVGAPSANNLSLPVTATVAEAEAAFGTAIDRIETPTGRAAFANRSAPLVPAAAAPYVEAVLGLSDLETSRRADPPADPDPRIPGLTVPQSATSVPGSTPVTTTSVLTGGPQPCAAAIKAGEDETGYTADEFATAYDLNGFYAAGNFGAGQTVALLELEPFFTKDINDFQNCYGTHVPITIETVGEAPPDEGEDGEAAMDIENVISLAPGAQILVYQSDNDEGAEAEILSAYVSQSVAKVMSSSWGLCERFTAKTEPAAMTTMKTLLQEAAAQGQSFFAAAGDFGSTDCYDESSKTPDKSLAVDYPPSDPFATAVGGTRMEDPTGAATDYLWDEAPEWGAGGGGLSEYFAMPAYQQDAAPALGVVDGLSSGAPCHFAGYCRQVPDVSADAAVESGWVIHAEGHWEVNGGTSAAAPFWAALTALTNASPSCAGHPIGFANPALYAVGGTSYATAFRDVTGPLAGGRPTTNRFDEAEPFPAKVGYDMASGLGAPIGTSLAASLCALANPPATVVPPTTGNTAPPAAPPVPSPATVSHGRLANVLEGKPRLTFSLAAREGAKLTNLTVAVPPALDVAADSQTLAKGIVVRSTSGARVRFEATSTPGTIRIRLRSPQPGVKLTIRFPALATTPKLAAHIREGRTHKLGLVITTRESGGTGARLPLTVAV
jgi:subtilase family serine protease